jgi:hypothetical protein
MELDELTLIMAGAAEIGARTDGDESALAGYINRILGTPGLIADEAAPGEVEGRDYIIDWDLVKMMTGAGVVGKRLGSRLTPEHVAAYVDGLYRMLEAA